MAQVITESRSKSRCSKSDVAGSWTHSIIFAIKKEYTTTPRGAVEVGYTSVSQRRCNPLYGTSVHIL